VRARNTRTEVSTHRAAIDSTQAGRRHTLAVFAVTLGLAQLAFLSWADTHLQTSTKNGIAVAAFLCYFGLVVMLAWRSEQSAYWTAWALLGVYTATEDMATGTVLQGLASWGKVLPMNLLQALVWGLSGRGIIAAADRFPVDEPSFREWQRLSLQVLTAPGPAPIRPDRGSGKRDLRVHQDPVDEPAGVIGSCPVSGARVQRPSSLS